MSAIGLTITCVNATLFGGVLVWCVRRAAQDKTRVACTQFLALALLMAVLITEAMARVMAHAGESVWLSDVLWRMVAPIWELWHAAAATAAGVFAAWAVQSVGVRPDRAERVIATMQKRLPDVAAATARLTAREVEVLGLLAKGQLKDAEIARELGISNATAATHVRNMFGKTGLHNRRDLAVLGFVFAGWGAGQRRPAVLGGSTQTG